MSAQVQYFTAHGERDRILMSSTSPWGIVFSGKCEVDDRQIDMPLGANLLFWQHRMAGDWYAYIEIAGGVMVSAVHDNKADAIALAAISAIAKIGGDA